MSSGLQRARSGLRRHRDAVVATISAPAVPLAAKLQFIQHGLWLRSRLSGSYRLRFSPGDIRLSYSDNETDRNVVWDVFIHRSYGSDFGGATVIDVGAHKGYFGAYAAIHGARRVVSYEPERENFSYLERAALSFRPRPCAWTVRRAAVAGSGGEVELRVDPSSWAHSLARVPASVEPSGETQVVEAISMADVLSSAIAGLRSDRVIVKVDAEGAECEIVLETSVELWASVDEVFIEFHDFAPCTSDDLLGHLSRAGFEVVGRRFDVLHLSRGDPSNS